jgi:small conductance mechanosensitive channel
MGDDLGLPPVTLDNVLLGLAVLVGGVAISFVIRLLVRALLRWRDASPSSRRVFGLVTQWVVVLLAFVSALTVTFPSVKPVNALGGLGIISIAAGIAFQTVLGNMFAGLVILARDSFRVGDQIEVEGVTGTVTKIQLSNTAVRTFDGRKVLVPNATLHGQLVTVQTGYEEVRSTVTVEIDDQADLRRAHDVAVQAMREVATVVDEPAPQALLSAIGSATVTLELRFWSGARQMETRQAQNDVIVAVLAALREAGVATGSDVLVLDAAPRLRSALEGGATRAGS